MRADTCLIGCNIRTIGFPRQSLVPKRMEAQGVVSKNMARGKVDCEMVADGT